VKRRLEAGEPYTIRFKVAPGKRVEINDIVRGTVAWDADATVGDFILLRSTGVPVYNFCVAGQLITQPEPWSPRLAPSALVKSDGEVSGVKTK
jgi:hypothetical protein